MLETVNFTSYHLKRRTQLSLIIPVSSLYSWVFSRNVCSSFANVKSWNTNSISAKKKNIKLIFFFNNVLMLFLQRFPFKHSQSNQRHTKHQYTTFWMILPMNNLYMILMIQLNFLCKMKKKDKSNRKIEKILTNFLVLTI